MAYFGIALGNAPNANRTGLPKIGGTQLVQMEKAFRKKFRDQSIIPLITNSDWKGRFRGTGTQIKIPVLPTLTTSTTTPDAQVQYQTPVSTEETFTINRERYWGLHMVKEDELFADFNITSPLLDEQAKVMSEDVELELLGDIPTKAATANKGNSTTGKAGYVSGNYAIGSATNPTFLYKTDAAAAAGSSVSGQNSNANTNKLAAPDFMAAMASVLAEQPGGKVGSWRIVIPTVIANLLQTSELKQADLTGDATSTLRKSVSVLGSIAGMDVIVSDKLYLAIASDSRANVYPIIALDTTAITFAEEVVIKEKIQDKDYWGDFHRCKMIYDWFVRYPERFATGYVKIGA